jgi:hypothetical protein
MRMELQSAVEEPLTATALQNNGAHIHDNNDTTNDDRFEITLSVSTTTVSTKEQAKKETDFTQQTFVATPDSRDLESLFQTRLYSTNIWASGCCNDAYIGMTGVTLDFDHGITIP